MVEIIDNIYNKTVNCCAFEFGECAFIEHLIKLYTVGMDLITLFTWFDSVLFEAFFEAIILANKEIDGIKRWLILGRSNNTTATTKNLRQFLYYFSPFFVRTKVKNRLLTIILCRYFGHSSDVAKLTEIKR